MQVPPASGLAEQQPFATEDPLRSFQPQQIPSLQLLPAAASPVAEDAGASPSVMHQNARAANKLLLQQGKAAQQRVQLHKKIRELQQQQEEYEPALGQDAVAPPGRAKRQQVLAPDTPESLALAVQPTLPHAMMPLTAPQLFSSFLPGVLHMPGGLVHAPGALLLATMQQLQGSQLVQFMGGLAMTAPREAMCPLPAPALLQGHCFPGLAVLPGAAGLPPFLVAAPLQQPQLLHALGLVGAGATTLTAHVSPPNPAKQQLSQHHASEHVCAYPPADSLPDGVFRGVPLAPAMPSKKLHEPAAAPRQAAPLLPLPPSAPEERAAGGEQYQGARRAPAQQQPQQRQRQRHQQHRLAAAPGPGPSSTLEAAAPAPAQSRDSTPPAATSPAASPAATPRAVLPARGSDGEDMGLSWTELAHSVDVGAAEAAARGGAASTKYEASDLGLRVRPRLLGSWKAEAFRVHEPQGPPLLLSITVDFTYYEPTDSVSQIWLQVSQVLQVVSCFLRPQ